MNKKILSDKMVIDVPVRIFKYEDASGKHIVMFPKLELTIKSVVNAYLWFDSKLDSSIYKVEPVIATGDSYKASPYLVITTKWADSVMGVYLEPYYTSNNFMEKTINCIGVDENGRLVESNPEEFLNSPDIVEVDEFPDRISK